MAAASVDNGTAPWRSVTVWHSATCERAWRHILCGATPSIRQMTLSSFAFRHCHRHVGKSDCACVVILRIVPNESDDSANWYSDPATRPGTSRCRRFGFCQMDLSTANQSRCARRQWRRVAPLSVDSEEILVRQGETRIVSWLRIGAEGVVRPASTNDRPATHEGARRRKGTGVVLRSRCEGPSTWES